MAKRDDARQNRLLACLSKPDLALLERAAFPAVLKPRQCIEAANRPAREVYFPYRGIVSVVALSSNRQHQSEVGLIGPDGMTGLAVVMGASGTPYEVAVQIPGEGLGIAAADLARALAESPTLGAVLARYVHVFTVQAAHTALANARGTLEQRLARWLLMAADRMPGRVLPMTHEFLAFMLGARRAGVTVALHALAARGHIALSRGAIAITDRAGLERCSDGLYGTPERELDRLLPA